MENKIIETIKLILGSFNYETIIFGGSISDYLNFQKNKINFKFKIRDIDLIVYDYSMLEKLEFFFKRKSKIFTTNEHYDEYHLITENGVLVDIFISKDKHIIDYSNCFGLKIKHHSIQERNKLLLNNINGELISNNNKHERIFKHLKKIMIYKKIINGEH